MDSGQAAFCTKGGAAAPAREARALELRADGAAFGAIGAELGIHPSTASRLVARCMRRLGVRTQADLVAAMRSCSAPVEPALPSTLTAAEREVATLVIQGLSNAEVGARRGTSARTVANQLQSVYLKLGLGSRAELIALAIR